MGLPSWRWCQRRVSSSGFVGQRSRLEGDEALQRVAVCLFVAFAVPFCVDICAGRWYFGEGRGGGVGNVSCANPAASSSSRLGRALSAGTAGCFSFSSSSAARMSLRATLLTCAWQVSCVLPQSCQEKAEGLTASACWLSVRGVRSR